MECLSSYLCNKSLLDNIKETCDNPMFSGMDSRAFILNYTDIDKNKVQYDATNGRIVTDLGVASVNFIINARQNPFTGTGTTVEVGDYKNTFSRTVSLFVPMDGAAASKAVLDPLANGKFVVILRNSWVNDAKDNEYQIYGLDKGLAVSSMTQTKYENNDYWVVEMQETGVMTSGRFLMYNGEKNVADVTVAVAYHQDEGSGMSMYDAVFTKGSKMYSLLELTGDRYFEDLTTSTDDPTSNEHWENVDGNVEIVEYAYPKEIVIDGTTYQLRIPNGAFAFGDSFNGDWLWRQIPTGEYLCGLVE